MSDEHDNGVAATGMRERGRLRRRLRELRQLREVQRRDLGGLVLELRRSGSERDDLVDAKVAVLDATDAELKAIEDLLDARVTFQEIREAGVGGTCPSCHALHGSLARFCSTCGTALREGPRE